MQVLSPVLTSVSRTSLRPPEDSTQRGYTPPPSTPEDGIQPSVMARARRVLFARWPPDSDPVITFVARSIAFPRYSPPPHPPGEAPIDARDDSIQEVATTPSVASPMTAWPLPAVELNSEYSSNRVHLDSTAPRPIEVFTIENSSEVRPSIPNSWERRI